MEDAIFAYWAKAPSHLAPVAVPAQPEQIRSAQEDYGAFATVFSLRLPVGSKLFQSYDATEDEVGNLIWVTLADGARLVLHDPVEHGYEGQLGISYGNDTEGGQKMLAVAEKMPLELVLCFQYNGDEADILEDGNSEEIQDYYSWLAIYVVAGDEMHEIVNIECA